MDRILEILDGVSHPLSILPSGIKQDAARAAERLRRMEELDTEIDAAPAWGAALSVRLEERDGLARSLGLPLRASPAQRLPTGTMMLQLPPGSRVDYLQIEAATLVTIRPEREPGEDEPPYPGEPDGEGSDAK